MVFDGITRDPRLDLRRNTFPPISRLPAEILANIFIHNARNSYVYETDTHPKPARPSWVNVSYVCRRWRDTALNCQTLWTYIPTTSQRWTQELLARSQNAPLKICIQFGFVDGHADRLVSHVLPIAERHSQRIQKLHLDFLEVSEECSHRILSKFLCLPCLQHLEISNLYSSEESLFPFVRNAPVLHTLVLEDCCMPWNSLEPSALTTLDLNSVELPFPENITMAEFLAMLRRMPHLVNLSIHGSLHIAYDFLLSGEFDAAPMINLSNMSIGAPISTINALLSYVDIPLTTKVNLYAGGFPTIDDFTRLASLLAQRINPTDDPTLAVPKFRSLTINIGPMAVLVFSTSERGCPSPFSALLDENTRLRVSFEEDIIYARPSATLSHMCRSIPFTSIRSVHFTGESTGPLDFWRDMLASFPNVRHIKLVGSCNDMSNIASMLSLLSHDGCVDEDQNEILVPVLEELELSTIIFSGRELRSNLGTLRKAISSRIETQR